MTLPRNPSWKLTTATLVAALAVLMVTPNEPWMTGCDVTDGYCVDYPRGWSATVDHCCSPHFAELSSPDIRRHPGTLTVETGQAVTVTAAQIPGRSSVGGTGSGDTDDPPDLSQSPIDVRGLRGTLHVQERLGESAPVMVMTLSDGEREFSIVCHSTLSRPPDFQRVCDRVMSSFHLLSPSQP